jgi:glutamine synthetase
MPALVALTCPSCNSYRRLQPRSWSTSDVVWGFDNRQAAVCAASPFWGREMETSNIETKASDSTSNPYISLAGMIAAGLDGIDNKIDPRRADPDRPGRLRGRRAREARHPPRPDEPAQGDR